jgi:phage shock protein C
MVSVIGLVVLGIIGLCMFVLLAGLVALVVALSRRSRCAQEEQSARVARQIEKIDAMLASGRISATESAEWRQALAAQGCGASPGAPRPRLCKSPSAVLTGVCGGLAEWLNWDPTLVRVGYVLLTLLIAGFPGIIIYVILAVVMPPAVDALPSRAGRALLTLLLVALGAVLLVAAAAALLVFGAHMV